MFSDIENLGIKHYKKLDNGAEIFRKIVSLNHKEYSDIYFLDINLTNKVEFFNKTKNLDIESFRKLQDDLFAPIFFSSQTDLRWNILLYIICETSDIQKTILDQNKKLD